MHILSGKLKGRKLANCKASTIRPAMALVRKSIFDTLQDCVTDANVLDLCAGSGILGIEALSRGARKLTLIDSDRNSIKLIYKNLELCNLKAKVILGRLPKVINKVNSNGEQFNLIFLDPPYGQGNLIENVLEMLYINNSIARKGLISIETESKCNFTIPETLKLFKEKKYGNTKVTILLNV